MVLRERRVIVLLMLGILIPWQVVGAQSPGASPATSPGPGASVPVDCLATYPDLAWDEPAPDVLAERCREQGLREGMDGALAYAQDQVDYAGMAFERDGGFRASFWFTGDVAAHETALATMVPVGMPYEVLAADLTLTELEAIKRVISADTRPLRRRGIRISTVGADVVHNVVEVGLRDPNDEAQALLQRRYGPHVVAVLVGPISED